VPFAQPLTTTSHKPRARRTESAVALSLRVLLRRRALDAHLAAGIDPDQTPELARRARQLCDLDTRRPLGRAIEAIVARADTPGPTLSGAIPAPRSAIDFARPALTQLAIALRCPEPVCAQGVAEVVVMLRDGAGPLYVDDGESSLYFAARRALLHMRPCAPSSVELVER
jgi:hypothetical protein